MRRTGVALIMGAAVLAAGIVGRATAQGGAYAGGLALVGVASIEGYSVEVQNGAATIRGTVRNVSDVPLADVAVTVWDNESVRVPVGDLAPGEAGAFVATVDGGPNWAWNANVTATVTRGAFAAAALPSAGR